MSHLSRFPASFATAALLAALGWSLAATAQEKVTKEDEEKPATPTLNVGDAAPALKVEKFIKGEPVKEFKAGRIYVVEFWSTWCGPCKAAMPHMTELQKKFKEKVTFISVNIWEDKDYTAKTLTKVEEFVKKNDERMGYTVAYDGAAQAMDKTYMDAAGEDGIPTAFIITGDAKIAFIGHPAMPDFEQTLQKLVDGKFDMPEAIKAAKERRAKAEAQAKAYRQAAKLSAEAQELMADGKTSEALAKLDEIAKLIPDSELQIELQKFGMLIEAKKYEQAYAIAAKLVEGPAKDDAMLLNSISWAIVDPEAAIAKPDLALAFKAAERAVKLSEEKDPAILDTLARCYWLKGEKPKAIELQTKAVGLAKGDEYDDEMREGLKKTLDEYKKGAK